MKVFWFSFMVASNIFVEHRRDHSSTVHPGQRVTGGASEFIGLDYLERLTSLFPCLNVELPIFDNKKCHRHYVYGIDELPFLQPENR
jgi:hypothetical protein